MPIPVLAEIERWITEHGSAAILKEHLALLQAKIGTLKEEVARLEKENLDLKSKLATLDAVVQTVTSNDTYVEHRGALFKRKPNGTFHVAVYCPRCKTSASSFPPGEEFNCNCGWFSSFTERDLANVLRSIAAA